MLIHWIWLSTRSSMTDRTRVALLQQFADAEDIYFADREAYAVVEGISEEGIVSLQDKELSYAEEILGQCARKGIHILCYRDAAYPNRLKNIPDPPVVLYYKGRLPDFDALPLVAVVGTRKASAYGMTTAKRLGYQIASCGGVVVSGAAFGIDAMAMRGALTAGVSVVGVLGNGVDIVYPLSNRSLYADIERNGCLLSEFPPETPPHKWNFPKRNRIISGLSCGVLVVEAPERSGALITARQAADQGRDVFVVPGNIDVATCVGSNALLRDGAVAVSSGWDVMSEYVSLYPDKICRNDKKSIQSAYPGEVEQSVELDEKEPAKVAQKVRFPAKLGKNKEIKKKKEIDNGQVKPYIDAEKPMPELSETEKMILNLLKEDTLLADDIIAAMGVQAGSVLAALTMLEIKGVVTRLPGKRVRRRK